MNQQRSGYAVTVTGDREVVMSRVFDAPRELVFKAHTSCEHLRRWWARGNPMDCDVDFRPGGRYRFVEHSPEGDHAFRGEYREIIPNEKIVQTFEWEGLPGHIVEDTHVFTDTDGKTTITTTSVFASTEDRDGMLSSGMADGAEQSARHLDELLASWV
jgi:uncharacterized protein YndB with AHSA1/START domain